MRSKESRVQEILDKKKVERIGTFNRGSKFVFFEVCGLGVSYNKSEDKWVCTCKDCSVKTLPSGKSPRCVFVEAAKRFMLSGLGRRKRV